MTKKSKDMIKKEKKLTIPTEPPINTPERIKLPVLGNQIEMVKALDKDNIKDKDKFKERANNIRKEREEQGVGSLYSEMQPRIRQEINWDFVGQ